MPGLRNLAKLVEVVGPKVKAAVSAIKDEGTVSGALKEVVESAKDIYSDFRHGNTTGVPLTTVRRALAGDAAARKFTVDSAVNDAQGLMFRATTDPERARFNVQNVVDDAAHSLTHYDMMADSSPEIAAGRTLSQTTPKNSRARNLVAGYIKNNRQTEKQFNKLSLNTETFTPRRDVAGLEHFMESYGTRDTNLSILNNTGSDYGANDEGFDKYIAAKYNRSPLRGQDSQQSVSSTRSSGHIEGVYDPDRVERD